MLFIKGCRVVDPITGKDRVENILIDGEKIVKTGDFQIEGDHYEIDGRGLVAAPGLMDAHVHFRDPGFEYKEDIISGSKAAARGGVTSVICMANTKPAVDNLQTLSYILEKGKQTGIKLYQCATVTKGMQGKELTDMEELLKGGAVGFTDDGVPVMDEKLIYNAMLKAKELNVPISLHEEDPSFVYAPGVNKGEISQKIGYPGADALAEDIMVARDSLLALQTGCKVCIQHISSGTSVDMVRFFKSLGANLYAEATPHHFTLTEEAVLEKGTLARMNPPLRKEEDRQKIIEGIKDGTIDMIVTDHAPHSKEEKQRPMDKAPSGITGLETSLSLGIKVLVKENGLPLIKLIELMSTNPAKLYSIEPASIQEGRDADIVIFGEDEYWQVKDFASKAENSPFKGMSLPGKIHYTICKGNIIYQAL